MGAKLAEWVAMWIIGIALVCALLGAVAGGIIIWLVMR
jgi:hypothetical protein